MLGRDLWKQQALPPPLHHDQPMAGHLDGSGVAHRLGRREHGQIRVLELPPAVGEVPLERIDPPREGDVLCNVPRRDHRRAEEEARGIVQIDAAAGFDVGAQVIQLARKVAATDASVLITGESGSGKEMVAQFIHQHSRRSSRPLVAVNCAALPEALLESEMFGHVKGAFTGATAAKKGKFELADGATIFLDEVGDMSPKVQAKVLRVLEEQRFEPVGSGNSVTVDVRLIAATNKRLDVEIEQGNFRADLFYRLNVIPFELPPLRDRLEDVPLLVDYFNQQFSKAYGKKPKHFLPDAVDVMQSYSWPGNVRELRNTVERVVIMHPGSRVSATDLPPTGKEEPPAASFRFPSFKEATEAYHREFIQRKLEEADGNVSRAAELMGVSQPRISDLMRGRINQFTIDSLINMLTNAGVPVQVRAAGNAA